MSLRSAIAPVLMVILVLAQSSMSKSFSGVWQGPWIVIAIFAVAYICAYMWRSQMRGFVPIFAMASLSGVAVGLAGAGLPVDGVTAWHAGTMTNISVHVSARMFTLISLATMVALIALGASMTKKVAGYLAEALSIAGFIVGASIVFEGLVLGHPVSYQCKMMDNPGCAATFSVFGMLWLLAHTRRTRELLRIENTIITGLLLGLMAALLILVKASTPAASAAAGLLFLLWKERPKAAIAIACASAVVVCAAAGSGAYSIERDGSGRIEVWKYAFDYWRESWSRIVFGAGLGTTVMRLPLLSGQGWYVLHGDVLQVILELGIVGLGSALLAVSRVVKGLASDSAMLAVCISIGVSMITNFSGHIAIDSLWLLALVRSSI